MTPGALATSLIGFQGLRRGGTLAGGVCCLDPEQPRTPKQTPTSSPLGWSMQSLATRGHPAFQGSSWRGEYECDPQWR